MSDGRVAAELDANATDHRVAAIRGILGAVPFIGSVLTELVSVTVPKQRIDRVAKFANNLSERLSELEKLQIASEDPCSVDLIEEGMSQATRAVSEDRLAYLAAIVANGLNQDQVGSNQSQHLLKILSELNDIEVLWLRKHYEPAEHRDQEFLAKHQHIFEPSRASLDSSRIDLDRAAVQRSYKDHLARLGLLKRRYVVNYKTKMPEYESNGEQKSSGYEITPFGRLFLREIGLVK